MTLPRLLLLLTLPLYVLDQITKFWIVGHFADPYVNGITAKDPVIDGFFYLTRVHNQGVAFGFGNGTAWAPAVFPLVSVIAFTALWIFWKKGVFKHPLSKVAVPLLLCGILGNLTDRLLHGFVVDFLDVILPWYGHWPAFNVADSCICIAAVLFIFSGFLPEKKDVGV